MHPVFLDIRSPLVATSSPLGLIVAGVLLSLAIIFIGRIIWKRAKKS